MEIKNEILELNSKKSAGYDTIPAKIVQDSISIVSPPLTALFNFSRRVTVQIKKITGQLAFCHIYLKYSKESCSNKYHLMYQAYSPPIYVVFERGIMHNMHS